MKPYRYVRPVLAGVVLAAGFYWFTTYGAERLPDALRPATSAGKVEITEAAAAPPLDTDEQLNIEVYKKGLPFVVNITSTAVNFDFFYGPVPQQGQGSGFIIDRQGHILTNYHVIGGAQNVQVTLSDKKKYRARIIGASRAHDLAVLQIDAPNLQPAVLGDSRGLQVGQKVYAIGNPFGLNGTMTRGIVSSIRSVETPDGFKIDEAIQTDAAINPGNSGGPLLNSRAEVIGINSLIFSTSGASAGIGFAIPINAAKAILNDLVTLGRVRRPALGIRSLPIGPDLAAELGLPADYGVLIIQAVPGGAAARSGLRGGNERAYLGNIPILLGGDLIVAIDGEEVQDQQDLANIMNSHRAGDKVRVTFYRGKRKLDVEVTLDEAPQDGRERVAM